MGILEKNKRDEVVINQNNQKGGKMQKKSFRNLLDHFGFYGH